MCGSQCSSCPRIRLGTLRRPQAAFVPNHPEDHTRRLSGQGAVKARLRVYMCRGTFTVRGCPAATDGLDGELQGFRIGAPRVALLQRRTPALDSRTASVWASHLGPRREPGRPATVRGAGRCLIHSLWPRGR